VSFHRRRLPHWIPNDSIVFVTWRLAGSPPPPKPEFFRPAADTGSARSFRTGPNWLSLPEVADIVAEAIRYGASRDGFYELYAWAILPTHVHIVCKPGIAMTEIMRWLKSRTARRANRILNRTGQSFWQDESFDRWIRSPAELRWLIAYVENNPVDAGLAKSPQEWRWSSAAESL
jgi:putative transposase